MRISYDTHLAEYCIILIIMGKLILTGVAFFSLMSGGMLFAAPSVTSLENDARKDEELERHESAREKWGKAAPLREAEAKELEKIHRRATGQVGDDLSFDVEESEDDVHVAADSRKSLQGGSVAQLAGTWFAAGYDYIMSAQTNKAESCFVKARQYYEESRKSAAESRRKELVEDAVTHLHEIRVYRRDYEEPKDVKPEEAVKVWMEEMDILRRRGDFTRALKAGEKALAAGGGLETVKGMWLTRGNLPGRDEACAWLLSLADGAFAKASKKELGDYWNYVAFIARKTFRPEMLATAEAKLTALGVKCGTLAQVQREQAAFAKFPRPDSELVFPKTLADFGVKREGKTVRANDYIDLDSDGADMTKAVQDALDTPGVTTVVLGKLDRPWRIISVKPHSNQCIQLEKGVVVLGEELSISTPKMDKCLFDVVRAKNVIIEGLGDRPEDCFIGKYRTHEERRKKCKHYGGSGIGVASSSNVLIRNLTSSYCTMDGISIGGTALGGPSREVWVENCVFDGNYRQGCSLTDCDGIYFKGVTFSGTDGNEPKAGVDMEPVYPSNFISEIYFLDCRFLDNAGGGLLVAVSSYAPCTVCARRCFFNAQPRSCVYTTARTTLYTAAERPAPGLVVFEDCELERWMSQPAVRFEGCPLWPMKFRNTVIRIADNRPKGTVPDGTPLGTNESWSVSWADWKAYPFKDRTPIDISGIKEERK